MGFFFDFDDSNNIMRCCWQGVITEDTMFEMYSEAEKVMASRPRCRGIDDFCEVTRFEVADETIRILARMPSILGPESLHVIIAPTNQVYGMARMYEILSEQSRPNLHVVRTVQEAKVLLGITSTRFKRVDDSRSVGK